MREHELFGRALGLEAPWAVREVRFDVEARRDYLRVRVPRVTCPPAGCTK